MHKVIHLIILLLFLSTQLSSQAGILDESFSADGIFTWDIDTKSDVVGAVDVQPDGKTVYILSSDFVASSNIDIAIVRLNENGTIDSTFAVNGLYHYSNPISSDLGFDIQVLEDGKILAAGSHGTKQFPADRDFLLIKLNSDGTPDMTFGNDGIVIQAITPKADYAKGFVITEEGKIIVTGESQSTVSDFHRRNVVCRFDENGILDPSFGDGGIFIWNDDMTANGMNDVVIAADGNIVTCGMSAPNGNERFSIYKILEDGSSLDATFGDNGEILAPFGSEAEKMIIHSNGNLLLTGSNSNINGTDLIVLAYRQDGTANLDFGQGGAFVANVDVNDGGRSLAEQPGGRIIASGISGGAFQSGNPAGFLSVRMDAMGTLDTSWGEDGFVVTKMPTGIGAGANDVLVQADGKVVLAGAWATLGGNDMLVMRYANFIDEDMDGYGFLEDCNDLNEAVNPGVMEIIYNGIDDDCNPLTLDDDLDQDGFNLVDDCDDTNAEINPDATEIPDNGIDEDCVDGDLITSSLAEMYRADQFQIVPNPTSDFIYINYDINVLFPELIQVIDYTGKVTQTIRCDFQKNQVVVDLQNLPSGVFIISIHTKEGVAVKKVVKY